MDLSKTQQQVLVVVGCGKYKLLLITLTFQKKKILLMERAQFCGYPILSLKLSRKYWGAT